jgi:BlaI family penicillinase repressor
VSEPRPTDGELAILRVLWHRGPSTVREVHDVLREAKDTAYTTVLKMLTIMAEKGLVSRDETERSHRYAAAHAEARIQGSLLKDLLDRAFDGSALQLVQRALDTRAADPGELDAIAELIAQAKRGPRRKP